MLSRKLALAIFLMLVGPAFAVGNVTVTGRDLVPASNYTNSNTSVAMLNLSFAVTTESGTSVNVTYMNIALGNGTTSGNISAVELYLGNDTTVIGSLRAPTNATTYNISISNTLVVTKSANASVIVRLNISRNVTTRQLLSVLVNIASDIGADSGSNATLSGVISNATQLQDLHANVSIIPQFVDTNAVNQTIVYTILPTGSDAINRTIITIPSGYNFTNISTIQIDGSNTTANITTTAPNYINISFPAPTTQRVKVTFNVNTSATRVNSSAFTSTIDGGNRIGISTEPTGVGAANVTTQQVINVTGTAVAKAAAIVNGTDYWEFNFTLSFTANLTGLIQFKMTNWTDASSPPNTVHLNTSSVYYATLRNNSNFSDNNGKLNVTNFYPENWGLNQTIAESATLTLILRMIIPAGTAVSSTWASTYNFLFRATS